MAVLAIHPGEHLAEELKELNMSAAALARKLEVPTNRITEILNGRRAITGDTALRLAHFFGTSAEFCSTCKSSTSYALPRRKPVRRSRPCRPLRMNTPMPETSLRKASNSERQAYHERIR